MLLLSLKRKCLWTIATGRMKAASCTIKLSDLLIPE